jgi:serine/threonine-protein kinase
VVNAPLPDLRTLRPEVPAGLAQALAKGLSRDPSRRYASADQFAKVLRVHTIPVAPAPAPAGGTAAGESEWAISGTGECDVAVVSTDFVAAVPFGTAVSFGAGAYGTPCESAELPEPSNSAESLGFATSEDLAGLSELADVVATRPSPAGHAPSASARHESPWKWVALGAAPILVLALALILITVFR